MDRFFADFTAWLNAILATYIADNTARVAALLEPAIVTLGVLYIIVWGYLQLTGKIEEPFVAGAKRILTLAVILGVSLNLWLYNELLVNTFFEAPAQLAAGIVGADDSVGTVDRILVRATDAGALLIAKGGIFDGNVPFYVTGFAVDALGVLTAVYAMFLLALSRVALSVLLALGPLFVALLMFETSKRFFEAYLAQLANYALIAILTALVASLMLTVVTTAAEAAVAAGGDITIAQGIYVCIAAVLTLLIMRQVMPIAAGLASGLALSTFGLLSAGLAWGFGRAVHGTGRAAGQFTRGWFDKETTRWDPLSRKAGFFMRQKIRGMRADNAIRAR